MSLLTLACTKEVPMSLLMLAPHMGSTNVIINVGVHAHESYYSQFVCVCVLPLAPTYDVCATN